jgi:hypothetical protein
MSTSSIASTLAEGRDRGVRIAEHFLLDLRRR